MLLSSFISRVKNPTTRLPFRGIFFAFWSMDVSVCVTNRHNVKHEEMHGQIGSQACCVRDMMSVGPCACIDTFFAHGQFTMDSRQIECSCRGVELHRNRSEARLFSA